MTILHSCCCWRSVRKGSYACGIYTAFYYTLNAAHSSFMLHEELNYFKNTSTSDVSVIDHDTTSETSLAFTVILLFLSTLGVLTTSLLLYGLYKDYKYLLIPWICNILIFIAADFSYVVYSLVVHAIYSLLCVVSQYQELKAGRGRAVDDLLYRVPNVHYSSQPTATSYLSSRRQVTYYETKPTPTQSPTGTVHSPSIIPDILSPNLNNVRRGSRKSVKFPDTNLTNHNGTQFLDTWAIDVRSPILVPKKTDTAPLLESNIPVTQS